MGEPSVPVIDVAVTAAQGRVVGAVQIDLVVAKAVVDCSRIGQHGHVTVLVIGKAHGTGVRATDPGHPSHCIVGVSSGLVFRIGDGFEDSLSIVGERCLSGIGCDRCQPTSGVISITCIIKTGNAETCSQQGIGIISRAHGPPYWGGDRLCRL